MPGERQLINLSCVPPLGTTNQFILQTNPTGYLYQSTGMGSKFVGVVCNSLGEVLGSIALTVEKDSQEASYFVAVITILSYTSSLRTRMIMEMSLGTQQSHVTQIIITFICLLHAACRARKMQDPTGKLSRGPRYTGTGWVDMKSRKILQVYWIFCSRREGTETALHLENIVSQRIFQGIPPRKS